MKMCNNINCIIFFVIVILLFSLYLIVKKEREYYENMSITIGNYLSDYLYALGIAILQKKDFINNFPKDNEFVKNLPEYIKFDEEIEEIYNNMRLKGITYENMVKREPGAMWFVEDDIKMNFLMCLKSYFHKIIDNAFTKIGLHVIQEEPVIHFRCADTPFILHRQYHFSKYEFYKKALEMIEQKTGKKYKKVSILGCFTHLSNENNKQKCNIYLNHLSDYLKNIGYETEPQCNTNLEDFAKMFYAPGVISIGSSFSFISGFFGNGVFVSSEHIEEEQTHKGCSICNDWMLPGIVMHNKIKDYYNTEEVHNVLLS